MKTLASLATLLLLIEVANAEGLVVAEYRADQDPVALGDADASVPGPPASFVAESWTLLPPASDYDPLGLRGSELSSSVTSPLGEPAGRPLSGFLDFRHRRTFWADQPYSQTGSITVGPRLALSPGLETVLYYGYDQDSLAQGAEHYGNPGDAATSRTGLAQIWRIGREGAQLRFGYEYAQGDRDNLYEDMQGHSLNVSGRFPLFWGLRASLAADYSRNYYLEYAGSSGLDSDRTRLKAAISRSFGDRLFGGMHFSVLDEEFAESPLSYRRHSWGLNLRLAY